MTATNMCSILGGKWDSPPALGEVKASFFVKPQI